MVVEPDALIGEGERARIEAAARAASAPPFPVPPFRLRLVAKAPWPGADTESHADHVPATVRAEGRRLRVVHRRLLAELDLDALHGQLWRSGPDDGSVEIALRVALTARLPSLGALPLHAAGVVVDGAGFVFFGPSGAGKSTLAGLAPGAVLSDELVAVTLDPPEARASGFWGAMRAGRAAPPALPLAGLVELGKGPAFRIEPLAPEAALRRLLGVLLVPPLPSAWTTAMALAARAARELPIHRMEWSPAEPPWDRLRYERFRAWSIAQP